MASESSIILWHILYQSPIMRMTRVSPGPPLIPRHFLRRLPEFHALHLFLPPLQFIVKLLHSCHLQNMLTWSSLLTADGAQGALSARASLPHRCLLRPSSTEALQSPRGGMTHHQPAGSGPLPLEIQGLQAIRPAHQLPMGPLTSQNCPRHQDQILGKTQRVWRVAAVQQVLMGRTRRMQQAWIASRRIWPQLWRGYWEQWQTPWPLQLPQQTSAPPLALL